MKFFRKLYKKIFHRPTVGERVETLEEDVSKQGVDFADTVFKLETKIEELRAEIAALEERVPRLLTETERATTALVKGLEGKLAGLEEGVNGYLTEMKESVERATAERLTALEQIVEEYKREPQKEEVTAEQILREYLYGENTNE